MVAFPEKGAYPASVSYKAGEMNEIALFLLSFGPSDF
jgi:hypothetical protein